MNLKVQQRNVQLTPHLKQLLERKAAKIQKMLPTFAPHDVDLHVTLEKYSRGQQFQCTLVLTLPQNSFRVEEVEDNLLSCMVRAFDELRRRIKKFKSNLNRERYWKREQASAEKGEPKGNGEVEAILSQYLDKIENYIRRELYHQILLQNLPPGLIQPQALVDEVFLAACAHWRRRPEDIPVDQWMYRMARDKIRQRLQELEASREAPHLEETVPAEPRWDDEALNFYQPDEVLHLEDLLPGSNSDSPEELLAEEEMHTRLQRAIAQLPASLRESFVLFALEGFDADEVAMIVGKAPQQIMEDIRRARQHLKKAVQL